MKAKGEAGYPEASLSTPYGKVLAFVINRTRVYVMTGWRKPRLRVGDDSVQVDFYLVRAADRGWRLDSYGSSFKGTSRRGQGPGSGKDCECRDPGVDAWLASVPQSAFVTAERLGFRHNKRTTLRSEIPDLIYLFENNAEIFELSADNRCLAGANPAVYERMRDLAQRLRALVEPVKEFGREVRATRFRPLEGRCQNAA